MKVAGMSGHPRTYSSHNSFNNFIRCRATRGWLVNKIFLWSYHQ